LGVKYISKGERGYLFMHAPKRAPSSLIAKNAEHLAHQLVSRFQLDHSALDIVELRDGVDDTEMLRWRFEWVGASARSGKSEVMESHSQRRFLTSVLMEGNEQTLKEREALVLN
jgi:hypothetical protein